MSTPAAEIREGNKEARASGRPSPVILVVPPFRSVASPAIGASLLKANLLRHKIAAEVLYLNVSFADRIGVRLYERLVREYPLSTGDFLFACVRFSKTRDDIERFVREILLPSPKARDMVHLLRPRKIADALERFAGEAAVFAEQVVGDILARRPWLVGFSSSSHENLASLSIARLLKQRDRSIKTVIGGANAQGEMGRELFAQFHELDYVCQGEGDVALVELAREKLEHRAPAPIPGMLRRDLDGEPPPPILLTAAQLEASPLPDFEDYFAQCATLKEKHLVARGLAMESSRGCWWGAKRPCAFCGLSGESFAFRAISPERVRREIQALVERYGLRHIHVVDLMLDPRTLPELFAALAEKPIASLFWETGGRLSRDGVELLARAGVRSIQPGLEALSDHSLRLLGRPTAALANVRTLKWCAEAGIRVSWNYLTGMPGESHSELDDIEERIRTIHHLRPPGKFQLIQVQRFSRYFQATRELGFGECWPEPFYRHVYPLSDDVIRRLAYFFETDHTTAQAGGEGYLHLKKILQEWQRRFRRSHLEVISGRGGDWILDTRRCARRRLRRLTDVESGVLAACDGGATAAEVVKRLSPNMTGDGVAAALESLARDRLVLRVGERFLSLPILSRERKPPAGPPGYRPKRLGVAEAIRALRRLRVSPVDAARFALASLPGVVSAAGTAISAAGWNAFARLVRLVLREPREREPSRRPPPAAAS